MGKFNLGKSLTVSLIKCGKSQAWLARKLNVSPTCISRWIRTGAISSAYVDRICVALDIKCSEFVLNGED